MTDRGGATVVGSGPGPADGRTHRPRARSAARWARRVGVGSGVLLALAPGTIRAQKTDVVTLRNGDEVTGEIKWLDRGQLKFSTDGMSTVYIAWQKVVTVDTDKRFYVELTNGVRHFGALQAGPVGSLVIATDAGPVRVSTQAVVSLQRLKPNFWSSLDGNLDLGLAFTQQNAKSDLYLSGEVRYPRSANLTTVAFSARFSRQDEADNIVRLEGSAFHLRNFAKRWFYGGVVSGTRNSQLSVDVRATVGGGLGRGLIQSNKVLLVLWVAPGYTREKFTGEDAADAIPLLLATEFGLYLWESLDTEVSSRLSVLPILNDWGRWRLAFQLNGRREIVKNFSVNLGLNEDFDSRPPALDAKKNDLSVTTSLGWTF